MNLAQKIVKQFEEERGWDKQLPDHVAKSISIEAAELLELFQWGNPTVEEIKNDPEKFAELKGELADVLIYSLHLANILGLNTEEIINAKLAIADKKYPAELMKQRSTGDSFATKAYLEIKKNHRRK